MHVILSCAMSVDGYIDDAADERLLLSNDEDFDRVDEVRASVDAILVGATTIRRDNPRLLVRSDARRAARVADGEPESPVKVTLTRCGDLDPGAHFFTSGTGQKLVYCAESGFDKAVEQVGALATVVVAGGVEEVFADLAARGVRRLMVEGGTSVHTQVLAAGLADELHLVVAPFFVGDEDAPRFVGTGAFPFTSTRPMRLAEARPIGDCVLLKYELNRL